MAKYSDSALRGWKKSGLIKKAGQGEPAKARTLSETLGDRGAGSLLLERRETGSVEVYFSLRSGGSQQRLKLGALFDIGPNGQELGIAYWRVEAARVSGEVREQGSIAALEANKAMQIAERERHALAEAARGSFHDLFLDYVADRRGKVRDDQISEFERILKVDLQGSFPSILAMPARDIRPSHIRQILTPIWDRGAKRQAAKVRSFLRAAFAYGATAEHSLGRTSGKAFGIEANPVDPVLVPDTSTPGERALSERELAHFWWTITETSTVGPVMSRLLQFVIATGGQRIEQVAREPWTSYDLEGRTLRLIDAKGRGGVRRVHLVPLTDRALEILARVREINGTSDWPWTTNGRQPISVTSPVHAIKVWLKSELGKLEDREISRFTPRDLRRTCAQLMQVNGVENRLADLLQSHGVSGVVAAHYRNNPEGYLPEKRRAVEQFEHALSKILVTGKASTKK